MVARSRIACLRIPRFPIAVHQKDEASLKGKPFALISGKGNRAEVLMCSPEASKRAVVPGMKVAEAKAVCAQLQIRQYDQRLYNEAQQQLCRALISCSPKVSGNNEPGIFFLDASGLSYLGGENKLCRSIHKIAARQSYTDIHVGIADSAFAALVASKFKSRQYYVVPAAGDRNFLSPLSIKQLPINDEMHQSLHELGIRTMGQLVSLSQDALVQRFGAEGVNAWSLAQGLDKREPQLPVQEKEFKCKIELASPIELLNEIQFVLKSMLDSLVRQLKQEALMAEELQLSFFNSDNCFDQRPIKLLRPAAHTKFLLEVAKLSLEAKPIQREVTGIELKVSRFCSENWEQAVIHQRDYNEQAADADSEPTTFEAENIDSKSMSLTLMLQRFVSRLGEGAVVKSVPNDQHIPEEDGIWLPVATKPTVNPVIPMNVSYSSNYAGPATLAAGMTLRKSRHPIPVLVEFQGELPSSITYEGVWYTVRHITQPERLSGLWWATPLRRSYYVALIEPRKEKRSVAGVGTQISNQSGLLVLLVHDHEENAWSLQGFYD